VLVAFPDLLVVGDVTVPRIYASLDNKQVDFQLHMIEVEGKINNQTIVILIDSRDSHIYLNPNMVERFHFLRINLGKYWLVQLATEDKSNWYGLVGPTPCYPRLL
jgi:hypothetical protein